MTDAVLVELCAGSAAVSLQWLSPSACGPLGWMGSKKGYAHQILVAMGTAPGAGARGGRVVLVEAGPWAAAWRVWRTPEGRADTIERLRAWAGEDPRELWTRLRAAPVPAEERERVAAWAVLMLWSFGDKPVRADGARWRTHGFNSVEAYRRDVALAKRAAGEHYEMGRNFRIPYLVGKLEALPDLSAVEVVEGDASAYAPPPGALVYIDPDYQGVTCGYGATFPRPDVIASAERARDLGCIVAVSEREPLPIPGFHHHRLGKPHGRGRTFGATEEWLTMSHRPVGVLDFGAPSCAQGSLL